MRMSELGTPANPMRVKCTSIGRPSNDSAYWSIVTEDGTNICLGMTFNQMRLHASQSATAVANWPAVVEDKS